MIFKKFSEKAFVNIVANIVLVLVVIGLLTLSFSGEILSAINPDAPQALYRGNTEKSRVSIMINVYWGTEYIDGMLQILDKHNAKATFFLGGVWVNKNNEMLEKIYQAGHEIANHGYFHLDHKKISAEKNKEEIYITEKLIETIIGTKTKLFAPPSGSYNATTLKVASELGYKTIMWSKDTIDWRDKNTSLIYSRATKDLKNGDLVLMHPTKNTLEALDDIIKFYLSKNFEIVTVSQNISQD